MMLVFFVGQLVQTYLLLVDEQKIFEVKNLNEDGALFPEQYCWQTPHMRRRIMWFQ